MVYNRVYRVAGNEFPTATTGPRRAGGGEEKPFRIVKEKKKITKKKNRIGNSRYLHYDKKSTGASHGLYERRGGGVTEKSEKENGVKD